MTPPDERPPRRCFSCGQELQPDEPYTPYVPYSPYLQPRVVIVPTALREEPPPPTVTLWHHV